MLKIFFILLGALLCSAPSFAHVQVKLPVPEVETLPNGLTLVWFLSDNLPMIDLTLFVKSGYRDDPVGKSGTAELVAALLDRGAAGMNAQQIARAIEMLGGVHYASADDDTFNIGLHGLAPDANQFLDLLGKIVTHADFPEAEVKREHARLLDRWNHIEDYSETLASLAYHRIIAAGTSYGRGKVISLKELNHISRSDVLDYYKKNFTPHNSILVIVGRVEKLAFRQKIESAFGTWQGGEPKRAWKDFTDSRLVLSGMASKSGRARKNYTLVVDRPELTQAQVRIGFRAPLIQAPEHYALVVANALLGEYFNSRLNTLIRDKLGLTYSIGSSFNYSRDFASFSIVSATRNESVGQLLSKTVEALQAFKAGPILGKEVETAKNYLLGGFPLSTSTINAVASRWLAGFVFGLGPNYLNEFSEKIDAVTLAQVQFAVQKDFDLDHLVMVVAGDAVAIRKSLKAVQLNDIKQVSVSDLR
jgi:zinc protease